jgi:hypothetical protein
LSLDNWTVVFVIEKVRQYEHHKPMFNGKSFSVHLVAGRNYSVAYMVMAVVFNTTFNNLSAISLWSVLLVEET